MLEPMLVIYTFICDTQTKDLQPSAEAELWRDCSLPELLQVCLKPWTGSGVEYETSRECEL